jgi:phage FluMu protein Com
MNSLHEVKTVRCAQCGRLKLDAAFWFVANEEHGTFRCEPLGERKSKRRQEPACGQHCAQKLFERYLAAETMRRQAEARSRLSAAGIE